MLKSSLLAACVAAALCTAVAIADDAKPAADGPQKAASNPSCLQDTGTRIKPAAKDCTASPGHRYSKQDIDRTGATTAGDALRSLSPSLTIH